MSREMVGSAIHAARPVEHAEPDMSVLREGRRAAPALPLEVFGPWERWIRDTADGTGPTPPDYCAAALLSCAAALIGNSRWVSPWRSWNEPPALWVGLIGTPSAGKSPAMRPLIAMIRHLEGELAADFEEVRRLWLTDREAASCARTAWEAAVKQASKDAVAPPTMPAAAEAPPEPARPRIAVSDTTAEALAAIIAGQPRGLLTIRDELAGWLSGFDRYSGAGADRGFWLECNGGGSYTIDRVKNGGTPIRIPHLTVSVLGGIQPDRLASMLFTGDDDGLASRLLLIWPDPLPPARPRRTADDGAAAVALRRLLGLELATDENGQPRPNVVPLADDAADLFEAWRMEHAGVAEASAGRLAGHMGKLPGIVLRLSLTLEHLWWAWEGRGAAPRTVSKRAVAAAAVLANEYFIPMAQRAYGDAAVPDAERHAATLARWIVSARPDVVGVKRLYREVRLPGLTKAAPVKEACERLVEADWLLPAFSREGDTAGRQRQEYKVNPRVYRSAQLNGSAVATMSVRG